MRRLAALGTLTLLPFVLALLIAKCFPKPSPFKQVVYCGKVTSQWEAEVQQWEILYEATEFKGGHRTIRWARRTTPVQDWARMAAENWLGPERAKDRELQNKIEIFWQLSKFPELPLFADPRAVPVLVDLLQSPDPLVQRAAIQALGQLGQHAVGAVPDLVGKLRETSCPKVRLDTQHAIWELDREVARRLGIVELLHLR